MKNKRVLAELKMRATLKNYATYPSDRFLSFLVPISELSLEKYEEKRKGKETGKGETKTILLPIQTIPLTLWKISEAGEPHPTVSALTLLRCPRERRAKQLCI